MKYADAKSESWKCNYKWLNSMQYYTYFKFYINAMTLHILHIFDLTQNNDFQISIIYVLLVKYKLLDF